MTTHTKQTIQTSGTSPLNQKDVNAIETAFSQFVRLGQKGDSFAQLMKMDEISDLEATDPAAFAYVVAKHGYTVNGTPLPNADPVWKSAGLGHI
jgi:hypothetical protein